MIRITPPEGFEFTGEFRNPKKGDYWVSLTYLLQGRMKAEGPLLSSVMWTKQADPRIILRKLP